MSLPKIDVPLYDLTVPSSGKKIKFRPYLVKEQKMLLMAATSEAEDSAQILTTIKQVINNCTYGSIDIDSLPIFDIEYIFLKLRCKSVGEIIEPSIRCHTEGCNNIIQLSINLNDIEVTNNTVSNRIELTNKVGIVMKYPTLEVEKKIISIGDALLQNYSVLYECVDQIYDETTSHSRSDFTLEEFQEFIENLDSDQFEKVLNFFNNIPKIFKEVEYTCSKCKTPGKVVLQGLADFLD